MYHGGVPKHQITKQLEIYCKLFLFSQDIIFFIFSSIYLTILCIFFLSKHSIFLYSILFLKYNSCSSLNNSKYSFEIVDSQFLFLNLILDCATDTGTSNYRLNY